jgi:hypothetical protein
MTDDYQSPDRDVQRDESLSCGDTGRVESGEIERWNGIFAKFLAVIRSCVPLGYEDETGFHVGVMSPEK